jgi:hypothetical protein
MSTDAESFVSFVAGLDPHENNARASMRKVFTPARYADLSAEVGNLPEALARAIAASDTDALTQIGYVVSGLVGEYEGHLELLPPMRHWPSTTGRTSRVLAGSRSAPRLSGP